MDLSQFKDNPKFIYPLLSFLIKRNAILGNDPLSGIGKDLFWFLQTQENFKETCLQLIQINKFLMVSKQTEIKTKIDFLQNSNYDLHTKKMKLLEILELEIEFKDLANNIMLQ